MNASNDDADDGLLLRSKSGSYDVFELIESGELPRFTADMWGRKNWINPFTARKILAKADLIRNMLIIMSVSGLGFVVPYLTKMAPAPAYIGIPLCAVWAVISALTVLFILYGPSLAHKNADGFQNALSVFLELRPMTSAEFPKVENAFEFMYWSLVLDMAKFVDSLQFNGMQGPAVIARDQLQTLFEGACGFCFMKNTERGLRPVFEGARSRNTYEVLDIHAWTEKHVRSRRRARCFGE